MLLLSKYLKIGKRLIVFLFLFKNNISQNLINNGSFENISAPNTWNNWSGQFINFSETPIKIILPEWNEFNSADLFASACTHTYASVPKNRFGDIYAKDGNNVVGFESVYNNSETKEYLYQQLTAPLQAGKIYCLSFYVSRADRISYAIKSIGAYFSNNVQSTGGLGYINANPQVVNQSGFITDTIGWTQIQGCFTAVGGEQYITIGNFNSNANTYTLRIQPVNALSTSTVDIAYYYIDDVTLIDQSAVDIREINNENSFEIYPNPTNSILTIRDKNQQLQNATIEIKNTLGQIVYFDAYSRQIDVSHLPAGIYFITLNTKETKRTIKFVKD
ncbi:MAG: T9SS type A sorting domain-containing protein [Bacteroidia bacterium]